MSLSNALLIKGKWDNVADQNREAMDKYLIACKDGKLKEAEKLRNEIHDHIDLLLDFAYLLSLELR